MAIGDIVTDAELNAPSAAPVSSAPQVFTTADLDAHDTQAAALEGIGKAYGASFADNSAISIPEREAAMGVSPAFSFQSPTPTAGPIQSGPRTYTTSELDTLEADALDDPSSTLSRDDYFSAKAAAHRLGRDTMGYQVPKMLEGLFQTAMGSAREILTTAAQKGKEALVFGPMNAFGTTAASTGMEGMRKGFVNSVGLWSNVGHALDESFTAKQNQLDAAAQLNAEGVLSGNYDEQTAQIAERANQLAATRGDSPEDVKTREWQNYTFHKGIDQELQNPDLTKYPGQSSLPKPLTNTADVVSMFAPTPENIIALGLGEIGGPILGQAAKATAGRALTSLAEGGLKLDAAMVDAGAAMGSKISSVTGFTPEALKRAGDFVAGTAGAAGLGGLAASVDPKYAGSAATAGALYGMLRKGAAIIRVTSKAAGTAGVFFREAADPMGPLRAETINSLANSPAIPEAYRAGMRSVASAIDSTPKRIANNPDLPDSVRRLGASLSSPALVASVRAGGAMTEGAIAGALGSTPFALASQNDGEGSGMALTFAGMGAVGGLAHLVGAKGAALNADIGRFLVDTHLLGGNVERTSALPKDRLANMAAMQGILAPKGVDVIPLSGQEYSANILALGASPGSAGFHLETATDGGRPRILINLDAKVAAEGHEFGHAIAAAVVKNGNLRPDIFNWVNQTYGEKGVLARGREYTRRLLESEDRAYEAGYPPGQAPARSLPDMDSRISMRMDELNQAGLARGENPLDFARNEIWAEQVAGGGIDLNRIRTGTPFGLDPSVVGESILGGTARVLKSLGVPIDAQTGKVRSTMSTIFKDNPLVGSSPKLRKTLANYIESYDKWLPGVAESANRPAPGIRVAATGNLTDFLTSPLTRLHETRPGVRENEFIIEENGVPRFKTQAEINLETRAKDAQVGMLYTPGRMLPRDSSEFGPRKIDGRIVIGGPVLPPQFDGLVHFSPYLRSAARGMEANRAPGGPGSSFNVVYHRVGTSESGTFKVINRGNTEAVLREAVPFGWRVSNTKKILANVLDMTALRGNLLKALNDGKLGIFNHDLNNFDADLQTYFNNHSKGLPGENAIGVPKKNAIDALLFAGATKANRAANPVYGDFGTRGTIRTLRLDRIQSIEPTGRTGLHFDYDKVNHNLMPDAPERPAGQAMPDAEVGVVPSEVSDQYDSSRIGSAMQGKVKPTTQDTNVGIHSVDPNEMAKQMATLTTFDKGVSLPSSIAAIKDPKAKAEAFIQFIKTNLISLHDAFPEELRARATLWYDGARKIAESISEQNGITKEQAAGIMAAFSPMKDWFQNVAMAERFSKVFAKDLDAVITRKEFGDALAAITESAEDSKARAKLLSGIVGKSIRQLWESGEDGKNLAAWATRVVAQQRFGLQHDVLAPEGHSLGVRYNKDGKQTKTLVWQSADFIKKALSIGFDGSLENISKEMGVQHKIRSFYNNIIAPNSPFGDVTIDTHAVNAGVLFPMGNKGTLVSQNFGEAGVAGGGNKGTYWLYHEAYKQAAKELGLQPRQLQSITWEAVRGLFPDDLKGTKNFDGKVQQIWENALDENAARKQILELGIRRPEWARTNSGGGGIAEAGPSISRKGSGKKANAQGSSGNRTGQGLRSRQVDPEIGRAIDVLKGRKGK